MLTSRFCLHFNFVILFFRVFVHLIHSLFRISYLGDLRDFYLFHLHIHHSKFLVVRTAGLSKSISSTSTTNTPAQHSSRWQNTPHIPLNTLTTPPSSKAETRALQSMLDQVILKSTSTQAPRKAKRRLKPSTSEALTTCSLLDA